MKWMKAGPGRYQVWVLNVCVTFKTQRDAERFALAGSRGVVSE